MYENLIGKYVRFVVSYASGTMRYVGTILSIDKDVLVFKNDKDKVYYFNMRYVAYIEEIEK